MNDIRQSSGLGSQVSQSRVEARPGLQAPPQWSNPVSNPVGTPGPIPPVKEGSPLAAWLRWAGIILGILAVLGIGLLAYSQLTTKPPNTSRPAPAGIPEGRSSQTVHSVSCVGTSGPDATTDSKQFVPIEGTGCVYHSGPTEETLILDGKLTGRNTQGTGMSVSIAVNGQICKGGEALNYSRSWTPMYSNCEFRVPADSDAKIGWEFLSPFGGKASVLRSSDNIAPTIRGTAISENR